MEKDYRKWIKGELIRASQDEEEEILVNSNRIYWLLSEVIKKEDDATQKSKIVKQLNEKIEKITDEWALYVPMKVVEVKECFGSLISQMPRNTFAVMDEKSS